MHQNDMHMACVHVWMGIYIYIYTHMCAVVEGPVIILLLYDTVKCELADFYSRTF